MDTEHCTPDEPCKECVANYVRDIEADPTIPTVNLAEARRLLQKLVRRRNQSSHKRKS